MKTQCDCRQLSFVWLMAYARRHGIRTFEELSKATGCGTGCGSCRPYLEELLHSGKLRCGNQFIELPHVALSPDEPGPGAPPPAGPRASDEPVQQGHDQQDHNHEKE